jgi:LDH2 family malate/lactate/ureidoglycolate dehydrogenase
VFLELLERLVVSVTESRRAHDVSRILLPGQLEWERRTERVAQGIPVSSLVLTSLDAFADEIGIQRIER